MAARVIINRVACESLAHRRPAKDDLMRRGRAVRNVARVLCPKDTGRLARSIYVEETPFGVAVGSDVHYAGYVELDTRYLRTQPYLRPALQAARH